MMFFLFLVPAVLYGIHDLRPAIREGKKLYIFAYLALTTTALVLWTLLSRGIQLTSPNAWIIQLVDMFSSAQ